VDGALADDPDHLIDGAVVLTADGEPIAEGQLDNGQVKFTLADLPVGTTVLQAEFAGNGNVMPASSKQLEHEVTVASAAVTMELSANPVVVGAPLDGTVTVAPEEPSQETPEGDVSLWADGTKIAKSQELDGGTVTFPLDELDVGAYDIEARYAGSDRFNQATSEPVHLEVIKADSTTEVQLETTEIQSGDGLNVTAQVEARNQLADPT